MKFKKIVHVFLAGYMAFSMVACGAFPNATEESKADTTVEEEAEKEYIEAEIITGNTGGTPRSINLDAAALKPDGAWSLGGNKVYFGQYDGIPTAYRVLASLSTQAVSCDKGSLLLDCDTILTAKEFDADFTKNEGQTVRQNEWNGSDIETWLNGNDFYGSNSAFSNIEKEAIASTTLAEHRSGYIVGKWTYEDYESTDNVFLLSAAEAREIYYDNTARTKTGCHTSWWLRSAITPGGNGAGSVHSDGHVCNNSVTNASVGVSPALNVNLSSVLFISASGTSKSLDLTETGAKVENSISCEWKLTLADTDKALQVTDGQAVTRTDSVVTVPYTYTGKDVTQISVIITDKAYTEVGAQVLYYGALQGVTIDNTTGTGTFTFPSDLRNQICETNYYAYIIAEDVNGDKETDYASEPYAITIPTASVTTESICY